VLHTTLDCWGSPRFCHVVCQSEYRFQNIVQLLFVWMGRFEFELGLQILSFRPIVSPFRVKCLPVPDTPGLIRCRPAEPGRALFSVS
jgi:hypothetical protein